MPAEAKILLVDDDPVSLRLLRRALETAGRYEIRTALDGVKGMAEALVFQPDLIISDKVMPHWDGFEFCRRVKAEPSLASTLFVLLTSVVQPETRREGLEHGADDCLFKPIPADELKARVAGFLQRKPAGSCEAGKEGRAEMQTVPAAPVDQILQLLIQVEDLAVPGAAGRSLQMAAAEWLAEDLGMAPNERPHLRLAAQLQEIGKIGLAPKLLRQQPSQMSPGDWDAYRTYASISHVLLARVEGFRPAAAIARHVFENWDGSGVPDHLQQGRILLGSRILRLLVEFFQDLKQVLETDSRKRVLERLQSRVGTLYDPTAYRALVEYVHQHLDASLVRHQRYVRVEDLKPGMKLAADLMTVTGTLLLTQNEILGEEDVRRILQHHFAEPFLFSIPVYPRSEN